MGVDVVFMDTDIVVFSNFVPRIIAMGADMAAMVEKCRVVDDKANYGGRPTREVPTVCLPWLRSFTCCTVMLLPVFAYGPEGLWADCVWKKIHRNESDPAGGGAYWPACGSAGQRRMRRT
eukprot:358897-Chlamydomonas_euryale.AAC.11